MIISFTYCYSLGSPSTSLEAVGAPAGQGIVSSVAPRQWVDSEDEAGDLEADWSSNVSPDILQTLSDAEKKRQEIINGLYWNCVENAISGSNMFRL